MSPLQKDTLKEMAGRMLETGLPLWELEKEIRWTVIEIAMESCEWNQCHAAHKLGIHRNTLARDLAEMLTARKFTKKPSQSWPNYFSLRAVKA